jgi:hypothetical protein
MVRLVRDKVAVRLLLEEAPCERVYWKWLAAFANYLGQLAAGIGVEWSAHRVDFAK